MIGTVCQEQTMASKSASEPRVPLVTPEMFAKVRILGKQRASLHILNAKAIVETAKRKDTAGQSQPSKKKKVTNDTKAEILSPVNNLQFCGRKEFNHPVHGACVEMGDINFRVVPLRAIKIPGSERCR
eukprot:m.157009 g.157009  ORF g.157009 m.157009 type:complete len:128 (+) comp31036_c1_seq2:140-523(+)